MAGIYKPVRSSITASMKSVLEEIGYPDTLVVQSHQNGLEPTNTYAVLNILMTTQHGFRDEATFMNLDGDTLDSVTTYSVSTQISFVGKDSEEVATEFRHAMINNRRCYEYFLYNGLGVLSRSDLRRIPQQRETEWVAAMNMDIEFSYAVATRQSYDWIQYITVNGEVFQVWNDNP